MMDLLATLSAGNSGAATASAGASADVASDEGATAFVAALAALLGSTSDQLVSDEELAELAAQAGAETELATLAEAELDVPTGWPLALLRDALGLSADPDGSGPSDGADGEVVPGAAESATTEPAETEGGMQLADLVGAPSDDEQAEVPPSTSIVEDDALATHPSDAEPSDEVPLLQVPTDAPDVDTTADADGTSTTSAARPGVAADPSGATGDSAAGDLGILPETLARDVRRSERADGAREVADATRPTVGSPRGESSAAEELARIGDTQPLAHTPSSSASSTTPRDLVMSDGVRRVLEAVELLEQAPPPRQLTIDVGEGRLRISLEEGGVRLSILGQTTDEVDDLLAAAEQALAERGFDLDQGGDDRQQQAASGDQPDVRIDRPTRPRRIADRGLRL